MLTLWCTCLCSFKHTGMFQLKDILAIYGLFAKHEIKVPEPFFLRDTARWEGAGVLEAKSKGEGRERCREKRRCEVEFPKWQDREKTGKNFAIETQQRGGPLKKRSCLYNENF